jgi:shikimate dehydrogenase
LGVNVTIPHKEKVIPYLDEVDKEAALIGAVNTIVNQNGKLHGYNTDGKGFIQSLEDEGFSTDGVNAFIIGAGGAARAIAFSLIINKAAAVAIYDIEPKKASDLIASLSKLKSKTKILAGDPASINQYRLIVNVTPMGLKDSDPLVVNPKLITSDHTVYDAIYKKTRLLVAAIEKGAKAINGSAMLLWQGVFAYELWTGIFPPVDVMRQALIETWALKIPIIASSTLVSDRRLPYKAF